MTDWILLIHDGNIFAAAADDDDDDDDIVEVKLSVFLFLLMLFLESVIIQKMSSSSMYHAVSYTHLTLPTKA